MTTSSPTPDIEQAATIVNVLKNHQIVGEHGTACSCDGWMVSVGARGHEITFGRQFEKHLAEMIAPAIGQIVHATDARATLYERERIAQALRTGLTCGCGEVTCGVWNETAEEAVRIAAFTPQVAV